MGYSKKHWEALTNEGARSHPRSDWLDTLAERYLTRRLFSPSGKLDFLEYEILAEVLELLLGLPSTTKSSLRSPGLNRVLEVIESGLYSEINLKSVAQRAGYSRSGLVRAFKNELKISPMAYVRKRRLEEARHLLGKGPHNVTEVALLVGYDNASAFCRAYRAQFGRSPQSEK